MRHGKWRMLLLGVGLLVTMVLTTSVLAGERSPSGGLAIHQALPRSGGALDLDGVPEGGTIDICMTDVFAFQWEMSGVKSGGMVDFTGTVDALTGWLWDATGTMTRSGGVWSDYWRADNPQADGCASGYTDYFEYFGSGKKTQSGTWTSYCSGVPVGSGTWSATLSKGTCP